jgi:hypothetical protein
LRTAWAAQPKPPKPQDAFEMSKQHLDGLAVAARRFVGKVNKISMPVLRMHQRTYSGMSIRLR